MPNMEFIGEEELYPGHVFRVYRLEDGGIVRYPRAVAPTGQVPAAQRVQPATPSSAEEMRQIISTLQTPRYIPRADQPTPPPEHQVGSAGYHDPSDPAYTPPSPLAPGASATVPHENRAWDKYFTPDDLRKRLERSKTQSAADYKSARGEADRKRDADAEFHRLLQSVIKRGGK